MRISKILFLICFTLVLIAGCAEEPTSKLPEPKIEKPKPTTYDECMSGNLVGGYDFCPTSNGDLYVFTEYGTWCLRDGKAMRVVESKAPVKMSQKSNKNDKSGFMFAELTREQGKSRQLRDDFNTYKDEHPDMSDYTPD